MKKILLPTLLATTVAPVVSLVGCANSTIQAFNLDNFGKQGPEFQFYHTGVNLSANTWYEANIDTSAHASELVDTKTWVFVVKTSSSDDIETAFITKANIWIDGNKLHQVPEKSLDDIKLDEFIIQLDKSVGCTIFGVRNLDGEHKIKIQFQIEQDVKQADLVYLIVDQT